MRPSDAWSEAGRHDHERYNIENDFHFLYKRVMEEPMAHAKCHHTTLVVGETCRVEQCSKGTIHLVLGDLTLRVSPSAFMATATALGVAARRLDSAGSHAGTATRLLC